MSSNKPSDSDKISQLKIGIRQRIESDGHKLHDLPEDAQEEFLNLFCLLSLLELLQDSSNGVRYYLFLDDSKAILETGIPEVASEEQKAAYREIEVTSQKWEKTEIGGCVRYILYLK